LLTWLFSHIRDPLEFVTPPVVVNTVVVPAVVIPVVVPVPVIVVLLIFVPDDEKDEEVVEDEDVVKDVSPFSTSEEDSKEGHANTTPSEPDDQPKSATEHVDELELIVGEEPKNIPCPSPSIDLLEELEDELEDE